MALAAVTLTIGTFGGRASAAAAASTWLLAAAFYLVAGILGGALYGLLRPLRDRYLGRLLTAYLILVLVYGGGTAALWPLLRENAGRATLPVMLGVWAVLALPLAPLYVWVLRISR
jgi:hypothetical protein